MQNSEPAQASAYPSPLDAIVLAGTDANPRRMIRGQNKAFLEIGGQTLVRRVVEALLQAATIGQVFVVGPSERLRAVLDGLPERVIVVEQAGKMLSNAWAAIYAAEARYRERQGQDDLQRPLLFISSDLPLASPAAVDDFVNRCAGEDERQPENFSMLAGVAEEASLARYYPDASGPGIRRPYVHLAECKVRLANIYVGRPRTLAHQEFLQTGFDHRKAEKWKNVVALAWHFLGQAGGWQAAWITLRLQVTSLAARGRKGVLYRRLRRGNPTQRIVGACGTVLGGSVRMVVTPWACLSLDADNDEDFQVLSRRFEEWRRFGPIES
ncbi:MAG: nucleotidyltransferase family protein [Lysobacterales bacterium]